MSWLQQRSGAVDVRTLGGKQLAGLVAGLFGVSLLTLLAPAVLADMDQLYGRVDMDQPYLSVLAPGLLYVRMPLSVLGACTMFMLPGLLLALALDWARTWTRLLVAGFGLSVPLTSGFGIVLDGFSAAPVTGLAFVAAQLSLSLLPAVLLFVRHRAGGGVRFALDPGPAAIGLLGLPLGLLWVLAPKFFWEAANDDGNQILEISRLLLQQPLPFLGPEAGPYRSYPGVNMMLTPYPLSAFVRMLGVHMAAVRLPVVLFIAALYAVIVEVAQAHRTKLTRHDHVLLSLALTAFMLTMSYSATWDPYCSDIGLPATQDTLLMFLFLAAVLALMDAQLWRALGYAGLLVLCSPNGLALLVMLAAATWLSSRHQPRRVLLTVVAGAVLAFAFLQLANAGAIMGGATADSEHSAENLGEKLLMVSPFDLRRVLFMLLPSGLFSMVVMARLKPADDVARALCLIALGNFAVFYGLSFITLHYFVPSMVLPAAAFARHFRTAKWAASGRAAAVAAAAIAIALCLPRSTGLYTTTRDLGGHLDVSAATGYWQSESRIFGMDLPMREVFVADSHIDVPHRRWGGSWRAIRHYAELGVDPNVPKNYFLTDPGAPAPEDAELIAHNDAGAIYVRDRALWERHKFATARNSTGRDFFIIPRPVLFKTSQVGEHLTIYSVTKELKKRPLLGYGVLALLAVAGLVSVLWLRRIAMGAPVEVPS